MSQKIILDIKGMHCRSCEILLEKNISDIEGIKKVRVNHKKGLAEIEYGSRELDITAVEKAVSDAGYSVGKDDKKSFFSKNPADYLEFAAAGAVLLALYAILSQTGILSVGAKTGSTTGLLGVLVVGLTAGISTCMALIGGLVLGISSRHAELHPEATAAQKFRPHIFFNTGRLASYILFGGLIGLLGSALKLSTSLLGWITIILGFTMLLLGLKLSEIFPKLHNKSIVLPKAIGRFLGLGKETKEYSHRGAFITGALTFFVPCGFTQAMQLYAVSTGSFMQGALIMGAFALGTLPGIISIGGITSAIRGSFAKYFFKFASVVVIALAVFNISNGMTLAGVSLTSSSGGSAQVQNLAKIADGKQIVEMTQSQNGYNPRKFTIKKGIPVVWKIKSTSEYSCAAYIRVPALGISQPLNLGENTIEFTPTQTGSIRFMCSMGMFSGTFDVVE